MIGFAISVLAVLAAVVALYGIIRVEFTDWQHR